MKNLIIFAASAICTFAYVNAFFDDSLNDFLGKQNDTLAKFIKEASQSPEKHADKSNRVSGRHRSAADSAHRRHSSSSSSHEPPTKQHWPEDDRNAQRNKDENSSQRNKDENSSQIKFRSFLGSSSSGFGDFSSRLVDQVEDSASALSPNGKHFRIRNLMPKGLSELVQNLMDMMPSGLKKLINYSYLKFLNILKMLLKFFKNKILPAIMKIIFGN